MTTVLDRLRAGEVIVGDGSYVFTLEKRGYVKVKTKQMLPFLTPIIRLESSLLSRLVSILMQ